jgi:hypothetical protein
MRVTAAEQIPVSSAKFSAEAGRHPEPSSQLTLSGVAVEKFTNAKLPKIKLRYDAPQSTFGDRPDIFYPPNLAVWNEKGVFQHPQAISLIL